MTNYCEKHPETALVCYCPKCRASAGGKQRKAKHSAKELSRWAKMGGRPRKRSAKSTPLNSSGT